MTWLFVGIDPGAKGSFCLLDPIRKTMEFKPTPTLDVTAAVIYDWLMNYKPHIHMIGVEEVHAIFGTSAKSNFSFGFNVGQVRTIASMTGIGVDLVQPKVWQKGCGITFKKGMKAPAKKQLIAATALRLYPSAPLYGPQGGLLDGRADALMIAHHLSLKYGITTP